MNGFKPCPFCGSKLFDFTGKSFFEEQVRKTGSFCFGMECMVCKAQLYVYDQTDFEQAVNAMKEKWNRREQVDERETE